MVQAVNTKAILTLAAVVRRPSLLVPHVSVDNISQLDYAALKRYAGIQAVIFDKDNTLTAPYAYTTHSLAQIGLQHAIEVFGKDRVAILSNSAGTLADDGPNDFAQALAIEAAMGIAVIRHEEKKPGDCLQDVFKHFDLQQQPSSLCMIGDRLLTDVVFGNLHGMLTVHTLPLLRGRENRKVDNWTACLIRPVENALLYRNSNNSVFGGQQQRRRFLLPSRPPAHAHWPGPEVHSLKLLPPKGPSSSSRSSSST